MSASALCIHVGMSACFARPFVRQSVLSARQSVRLMIVYHYARRFIFRPSICLIFRPSVCISVCMYVNMYLYRDERTVDIETWINLTDILSGLSLHWTLISFFFVFFFRVAVQTTALSVCKPFYAKTMCTIAKKVHIYLWAITLYYSTSRLWQWRRVTPRVNPKPVITFYNCKICWYLKLCTKTYYDLTVGPSLFNRIWVYVENAVWILHTLYTRECSSY